MLFKALKDSSININNIRTSTMTRLVHVIKMKKTFKIYQYTYKRQAFIIVVGSIPN